MRILFTGASSFTGHWFVRELAERGHEVVATFTRPEGAYDGVRGRRVARLAGACRPVYECEFGDGRFLDLVEREQFDLLCHHAADVTDYKSADFDVVAALSNNTRQVSRVLAGLKAESGSALLLTGSVFEPGEGAGSEGLPAFSPYGLSKALTAQVCAYHAAARGVLFRKFVIPNPFGPFEEPRFTRFLVKTWMEGGTPSVRTPAYVRDNIHVSLLALAYARFAERAVREDGPARLNPSGYAESQGTFARRFAEEMAPRLGIPCPLELMRQTEWAEPRVRINTDILDAEELSFDEGRAWDDLAAYYRQ